MEKSRFGTRDIVLIALFAALSYIGTMINFKFSIFPGGPQTMIHFGNIFCLMAALMLGGVRGGLSGSIGMGLYDATTGGLLYVPQTLILKFFIGLICGGVYKKLEGKVKNRVAQIAISGGLGMLFNCIFDPIGSYFTAKYLFRTGASAASIASTWAAGATFINAVIAVIVATILFTAIRPILLKNNYIEENKIEAAK